MIQIIPIIPHPFFVIPITIIIPILQLPWFSQAESPMDLPDNVPSLSRGRGSARHLLLFQQYQGDHGAGDGCGLRVFKVPEGASITRCFPAVIFVFFHDY